MTRPTADVPSWPFTVLVALALLVFAIDVSAVQGIPDDMWWRTVYTAAAVLFVVWRVWPYRQLLVVWGAVMWTAAFSRMIVFVLDGQRWTGAANNLLVMLLTLEFVTRRRWRR